MGENLRQQLVADVDRLRNLVVRYARCEASVKGACDTLEGAVQKKWRCWEEKQRLGARLQR